MEKTPAKAGMLPVWFFIGVIHLIYGVLIFITGLYELSHPVDTVLANLHAPIWWGAFIGVVGAIYVWRFRPGR
jgi:type VI protein secretion system component VasF